MSFQRAAEGYGREGLRVPRRYLCDMADSVFGDLDRPGAARGRDAPSLAAPNKALGPIGAAHYRPNPGPGRYRGPGRPSTKPFASSDSDQFSFEVEYGNAGVPE